MLGKLIKYDLKASARILILIHLLYLVLCISIRLFFINRLDFNLPANVLFTPVLICAVMVFLLIFVLQFFTLVLMAAFHLMPGYGNTGPDTMRNYIAGTSMLGGVITLVTAVIAYAATHYIMTKKINLL